MDAGLVLQYVIVALAVVASLAYVVRTRFPATWRRVQGWIAIRMVDSGVPVLASAGRRLAPAPRGSSACGACDGCGPDD